MAKHSFRDPATNVLKCWGHMDLNEDGDLVRDEPESFHLRQGEWYLPDPDGDWEPYTPPAGPDIAGFLAALDAAMTNVAANDFAAKYPLFVPRVTAGDWALAAELVVTAHTRDDIDDTVYNTVRDEAMAANVPLALDALP